METTKAAMMHISLQAMEQLKKPTLEKTIPALLKKKINNSILKIKSYGNSMRPILMNQDLVFIKKTKFDQIVINDIVTFIAKKHLITHRVIYKNPLNKKIITKGDNNFKHDGEISKKDILGKVYKITRKSQSYSVDTFYLIQSSIYFKEITAIISTLKQNDIPFVIIKGLPLHLFYEKSFPRKFFADCDILIKPQDLTRITSVFMKFDYKPERKIDPSAFEIEFSKKVNGIIVTFDIHLKAVFLTTRLFKINGIYSNELLNKFSSELITNIRHVNLEKEIFPILRIEYLIVYLALHIFHHNYRGYNRYSMLDIVFQEKNIDRQLVLYIIHKYKLNNFVYPVFYFLDKYYSNSTYSYFQEHIQFKKTLDSPIQNIKNIDIFTDQPKIIAGIQRYFLIFTLSPNKIKRFFILFNYEVYYFTAKTFIKLLLLFIKKNFLTNKKAQSCF